MRIWRLLPVVLLLLVVVPSSAAATLRSWVVVPTPAVQAPSGLLQGIDCPSASACEAVGSYVAIDGSTSALAERWNGTSWTIQTVPTPASTREARLLAVSCSAPDACTAVGSYDAGSGSRTLAERWNGSTWTIQSTPVTDATGHTLLTGVSCPTATWCVAVGEDQTSGFDHVAIVERWNGTGWATMTFPAPGGSDSVFPVAVSCASASACVAVGHYVDSTSFQVSLVERWNGTAWAAQTSPKRGSSPGPSMLTGVSCPSAGSCFAVGYDWTGPGSMEKLLVQRWNGTRWTNQTTPSSSAWGPSDAISCSSPTACTLVAGQVAERWNGTSWAIQTMASPRGAQYEGLKAVSCPTATACTAVGSYLDVVGDELTVAAAWNGTTWTIQTTPNRNGAYYRQDLGSVDCVLPNSCEAVGDYRAPGGGSPMPLAERWNGAVWTIQDVPAPAGATSAWLGDVSCSSATACTAVGNYSDSSWNHHTFAVRWDGAAWTIQTTPNPGSGTRELVGVSCPAADECWAVGSATASGTQAALVERWNGTSWTAVTGLPSPDGSSGSNLTSIACPSSGVCVAVGIFQPTGSTYAPFAERLGGGSWTVDTPPNPGGANNTWSSGFRGVSCSSATACTAVGDYYDGSHVEQMLAERWNGTSWTTQTTPPPDGATSNGLWRVSCPSATSCTAVGQYGPGIETLIDTWDGTGWTTQDAPAPASADWTDLTGVSCTSATECTAVGEASIGPGLRALAVRTGAPTLSDVSPSAGATAGGGTVTLTGTGFTPSATVKFGTVASSLVTFMSPTKLVVAVPAGAAGTVDVRVTTSTGTSAVTPLDEYAYGPPTVTSLSANAGPTAGKNAVTIAGRGFVPDAAVRFGGAAAKVTAASGTRLTVLAPAHAAGVVTIQVTTAAGSNAASHSTFYAYGAPTVTGVSPTSGARAGGTRVTIRGTGFVPGLHVTFGSVESATVTYVSATQITAVAPRGAAGAVHVRVRTAAGTSPARAADCFTYR